MTLTRRGLTLIEIVVASTLGALIAGGTMMAFTLSMSMTGQSATGESEALFYAQQSVEGRRNDVACDGPRTDPATCLDSGTPWTADSLPALPPGIDSAVLQPGSTREYQITPVDCDGVGGPGDCYQVVARVQWPPLPP